MDTHSSRWFTILLPSRVAEAPTSALEEEIALLDSDDKIAAGILNAVIQKAKIDNPINSWLVYCAGLTDEKPTSIIARIGGSMPDADLDFSEVRRYEVVKYLIGKYGSDNVCHIGTFGFAKAKSAIRDVCRTLGYPYEVGDRLAKLVLPSIAGKEQSLQTSYEKVLELARFRNSKGPEAETLRFAEKIEGRPRVFGTHASGFVVASSPVIETVPLARGKEDQPTTQYDMWDVEEAGLIKFDFLGLRALDTIDRTLDLVERSSGTRPDPLQFTLDDQETFSLLCSGDVLGVFQLEGSSGLKDLTTRLQPRSLEDLSLLLALYRPGPLASGMVDEVVEARAGRKEPSYLVPELEPILKSTAGVLVFQEQAMKISRDLAGYTLAESDSMRKAIGKKIQSLMDEQRSKFISGMVKNGFAETKATELFEIINNFADYSFNASHSLSYGYITYQTAYLKAHYPLEHICACLISDSDEQDKITKYISYCREKGIAILPPDINESGATFTISRKKNGVRFGLDAIKNVGTKPTDKIIAEREKRGPYLGLIDFCVRADPIIDKEKVRSLILAGAFDEFSEDRQSFLDTVEDVWRYKKEFEKYHDKMATYERKITAYREREDERRAGSKRPSLKLPTKPEEPKYPVTIPSLKKLPVLDRLAHENDLLGCFISGHPVITAVERGAARATPINKLSREKEKDVAVVLAVPVLVKETTTRKDKKKMGYITLQDDTGSLDVVIFASAWAEVKSVIINGGPAYYSLAIETQDVVGQDEEAVPTTILRGFVKRARLVAGLKEKEPPIRLVVPINKLYQIAKSMSKKLRDEQDKKAERIELVVDGGSFTVKMGQMLIDATYLPLLQRQILESK